MTKITLGQLSEEIPDGQKAWLDRDINSPFVYGHNYRHEQWRKNGFLTLQNFIPHDLINAYCARYEADNGTASKYGYLGKGTIYMEVPEIKNLCLYEPLTDILQSLIGEPMGLSLNLCNWVSTERTWHVDDYLNPPEVAGHYVAVWIALDDISADAGPFEFVPGSHKWPVMRGEKVRQLLPEGDRGHEKWPKKAEAFVTDIYDTEIRQRKAKIETWTGKKGDVLIWHSWLVHRGSIPKNPNILRKSLIAHYSGINHRPDMHPAILYENGVSKGYFFPF